MVTNKTSKQEEQETCDDSLPQAQGKPAGGWQRTAQRQRTPGN